MEARGYVSPVSTSINPGARISMFATENWLTAPIRTGGRLTFYTTPNGTNVVKERLTINHDGNIGIGEFTTPLSKLHVVGDGFSGVSPFSSVATFENNIEAYVSFLTPQNKDSGILFGLPSSNTSGGILYNVGGTENMQFRTGGNTTRMTITNTGNVGIGVSPTAKLTVNGDVAYSNKTNSSTTGTINNFNRAGNSVIRFDGIGNIILNGITGGTDGLIVHIYTTFNVTQLSLGNLNGGSLPENQIIIGNSVLLFNDGAITLMYDGTSQKWRVINYHQ
jgi:hypothetical protein